MAIISNDLSDSSSGNGFFFYRNVEEALAGVDEADIKDSPRHKFVDLKALFTAVGIAVVDKIVVFGDFDLSFIVAIGDVNGLI